MLVRRQGLKAWQKLYGVMLAVMLTACAAVPTAEVSLPQLETVILQLQWVPQAQFAGYYVALEKGWYAEEGLDVVLRPGGPDISPVSTVLAGNADFGTSMLADLVVAVEQGQPIISIAQIQQQNGLLLLARRDSGISSPQHFVGKRVGVWVGSWEAQFRALVAQQGLAGKFQEVAQGFSMDAFLAGELDVASAMIYNEYYMVLASGLSPEMLTIIDYANYGLDFPGDALFTTRMMVDQNPDVCVRFLRASLRGWRYALEHPEEAVDTVLKYDAGGTLTREHQLAMLRAIIPLVQLASPRPLGYTERSDVLRVTDILWRYGVVAEELSPDAVYTNLIWELATTE